MSRRRLYASPSEWEKLELLGVGPFSLIKCTHFRRNVCADRYILWEIGNLEGKPLSRSTGGAHTIFRVILNSLDFNATAKSGRKVINPECDILRRRLGSTLLDSTLSYRSFVLSAERVTFSIIIIFIIIIIVIMIVDIYTVHCELNNSGWRYCRFHSRTRFSK